MRKINRKLITFRAGRPVDVNNKCAQCVGGCKQHKALPVDYCPHFVSRKKNIPHPSIGEGVKNSSLDAVKSSAYVLTQAEQEASLKANMAILPSNSTETEV